ncbi:MAG: DUF177 domain-containing protein [Sinobacteraceae bacterium]|nr:DUF177 domain-containing protein [Nevskiaceae bacterium]
MSPPWSKPLDVERLADGGADVDFAVPVAELPRLRSRIAGVSGEVRGRVHFGRDMGLAVADLTLDGTAVVTCQRCLQAMDEPVNSAVRIALVTTQADVARVPEHLEPVLAADGRISIGELVEEELLLALPIVSTHAQPAACAAGADASPDGRSGEQPQQTQRPFEKLAELFKRS